MGGYGVYVWGSYAVTFALLAIEVLSLLKRKRAVVRSSNHREDKLQTGNSKLETVL